MRRPLSLSLCALLALPAAAQTVREVTLSTSGTALLSADARLDGDGLTLRVPRADVGAVLKSLRVDDPADATPQVTLPAPRPAQGPLDGAGDMAALVDALAGAPVTLRRGDRVLQGRVLGARQGACGDGGDDGCLSVAVRRADGRVAQMPLDPATTLTPDAAADRAALARALDRRAQARDTSRTLRLTSTDPAARDVRLGWLQPAPAWQTAWRAVADGDGGLRLTGWAVVENATGRDWDDVTLTLATGAVRTLDAGLYAPAPAPEPMLRAEADQAPAMAAAPAPVQMRDADSYSAYTLDAPVTLAAGQMTTLPFLRQQAPGARLTLYRGGSGARHPSIAVAVTNPLPLRLPGGLVTFYDGPRGHAGDARLPELAPGGRAIAEFATDRAVTIREEAGETTRLRDARLVDGVLQAEERLERRTRYIISGAPDAARTVSVLHPHRAGWELVTEGGTGGPDGTRFEQRVAAGAQATLTVVETRTTSRRLELRALSRDDLIRWQGRAPDAQTRALFSQLQELRASQARLDRRIADLDTRQQALIDEQTRLANLVAQLGADDPGNADRRARIAAIEDELSTLRARLETARADRVTLDDRLDALLRDGPG